jgi:hypothetical protein
MSQHLVKDAYGWIDEGNLALGGRIALNPIDSRQWDQRDQCLNER